MQIDARNLACPRPVVLTLEALPKLIDGLREKGYTLEPLDRSVTGISFAYADCLD